MGVSLAWLSLHGVSYSRSRWGRSLLGSQRYGQARRSNPSGSASLFSPQREKAGTHPGCSPQGPPHQPANGLPVTQLSHGWENIYHGVSVRVAPCPVGPWNYGVRAVFVATVRPAKLWV